MHNEDGAVVDDQTGLPNLGGWLAILEAEELRSRRHGGRHGLIRIELEWPGSGRMWAGAVAEALGPAIRETDLLARVDERVFGVLALHCDSLETVGDRLRRAVQHLSPLLGASIDSCTAGADLRTVWARLAAGDGTPRTRVRHVDPVVSGHPGRN